jgi:predicted membrane protein
MAMASVLSVAPEKRIGVDRVVGVIAGVVLGEW